MNCAGCEKELPAHGALCPYCGRFIAMEREDPPRDAGRTIAMIAITVSIPIAGLVGLEAWSAYRYQAHAKAACTKSDAITLQVVAEKYAVEHPGVCPTVSLLVAEKELYPGSKVTDAWDDAYAITCSGNGTVEVRSLGPDRTRGTADDIIAVGSPLPPLR